MRLYSGKMIPIVVFMYGSVVVFMSNRIHKKQGIGFAETAFHSVRTNQTLVAKTMAELAASYTNPALPNVTISHKNQTQSSEFSACLLTMDDSHFLIEWLAYHHHVLPLRHLIVAVDPHSKTSPAHTWEQWRSMGMDIQVMRDAEFMKIRPKDLVNMTGNGRSTKLHRKRQRYFLKACLRKFQQQGRKWVLLTDVDEYFSFNHDTEKMSKYLRQQNASKVAPFLEHELAKNDSSILQQSPCIVMPRLRYGSKESTLAQVNEHVPQGFNGSNFVTRWRKHASLTNFHENRFPKSMIDVSRVNLADIIVDDPHRPLVKHCHHASIGTPIESSPFVIRHYVGTYEQFTFRDDIRNYDGARKAVEKFKHYQTLDGGEDDHVRPWLQEFVDDVGIETATKLLKGVGDVNAAVRIKN